MYVAIVSMFSFYQLYGDTTFIKKCGLHSWGKSALHAELKQPENITKV